MDRGRVLEGCGPPQFDAVAGVVGGEGVVPRHEELGDAPDRQQRRGCPTLSGSPLGAPDDLPATAVHSENARSLAVVVVADEDQGFAMQHRHDAVAKSPDAEVTEIGGPEGLPLEGEGEQALIAEGEVHALPIGYRRQRGVGVGPVPVVVDRPVVDRPPPHFLSRARVVGQRQQGVMEVPGRTPGVQIDLTAADMYRRLVSRDRISGDGGRDEDQLVPDDRRRMPFARG